MKTKVVVIVGPTGVGKSQFALELAQRIDGEIVVADSMQIYRYLDIGTAKLTPQERALVPHHLMDIMTPEENFSAGQFRVMAEKVIASVHQKKKNVLVCGGTGLYIKALLRGLFSGSEGSEPLRHTLKEMETQHGQGYLYGQLKHVDPISAARIHPHDIFRTIRALEIYHLTGIPICYHHSHHAFQDSRYDCLQIGITLGRSLLYGRINQRCDRMMAEGFLDEVKSLLARGYHSGLRSMRSLGYRHLCSYLAGQLTLEQAVQTMKRDTRRFAKRQLTWFRADSSIIWVNEPLKNFHPVEALLKNFLSRE